MTITPSIFEMFASFCSLVRPTSFLLDAAMIIADVQLMQLLEYIPQLILHGK